MAFQARKTLESHGTFVPLRVLEEGQPHWVAMCEANVITGRGGGLPETDVLGYGRMAMGLCRVCVDSRWTRDLSGPNVGRNSDSQVAFDRLPVQVSSLRRKAAATSVESST